MKSDLVKKEIKMGKFKILSRKIISIVIVVLVLMIAAFAIGYYISIVRYDQKFTELNDREESTQEEANQLRIISVLLKANGELTSSRITLSENAKEKSLDHIDITITVLKEAYDFADEKTIDIIEDFRLRLATVKGFLDVDSSKAQSELDTLWREINSLISKEWKNIEKKEEAVVI